MKHGEKNWGKIDVLLILIALVPIAAFLLVYNQLPDSMAVHFGFDNKPNGFQSKPSALILFSLLGLGVPILLKYTRKIDPKQENYWKFKRAFEAIRLGVTVLLSCVFGLVLMFNLGYPLDIKFFTLMLVGLLFMIMGNYLVQIRYNFFFGIRTPWTLASEEVWRRTHRMAGPLYMAAGAFFILCGFVASTWFIYIFIAGIVLACAFPVCYSYLIYKKTTR
ncbi:SdpI family protein [Aneurinibacillus sp. Ricciae_BoGa-3]|uniref:SdpI family protein n=1 Tax=Aneurinibacillus sp. Ricciae_BoGa-3 TaxID=3022697 RepID=UPI0023409EB0|nr:SdpI family protein [Aneurinibacillus sp. Ricciae_BoGa-3]WCK56613.1 SdpI family protein [Aneurinibacillus sp. Ricciae_BoGa-3]